MSYTDVIVGKQSWSDYVTAQDVSHGFERALQKQTKSLQVGLGQENYRIALESGLGALGDEISYGLAGLSSNIELSISALEEGIDRLHADFNLLMGEVIWKLELQTKSLISILETLQAPLDTAAKELRNRAVYAYRNGWHEEALKDFLEAERKNYQDFAVHRSIANIYLYHLIDLPGALEYFRKAAKYARPQDPRQAAEAEYFAGVVCGLLQRFTEAMSHMEEAIRLNSVLYDAHYTHAGFAAVLGDGKVAVRSLYAAIEGDWRYHERARMDSVFAKVKTEIQAFLDERLRYAKQRAAEAKQQLDQLRTRVYALLPEAQQRVLNIFQQGETNLKKARTYSDYRQYSLFPARVDTEIRSGEAEKISQEWTDQLRKEKQEAERIARDRIRQDALKQERQATIKKAGQWLKNSLGMALGGYFLVGFGGCLIRIVSAETVGYSDMPFRAWITEAFYIAVLIAAVGIIGALFMFLEAVTKRDS